MALAAVCVVFGGSLAACVTTGSDEAVRSGAEGTTTTSEDLARSTTPNQASTTTSAAAGSTTSSTRPPSTDESGSAERGYRDHQRLEVLLPTPDEVGPGYEMTSDDGLPGGGQDAEESANEPFTAQCPGIAALGDLDAYDFGGSVAAHSYGPNGESTIGVQLADAVPSGTDATYRSVVEGLADCGPITVEDSAGNDVVTTIEAQSTSDHGDAGLSVRVTMSYELYGRHFDVETRSTAFLVDDVEVIVSARTSITDGGTVDPVDMAAFERLADLMEDRAASL